MVLCFEHTPKPEEQLHNEISAFIDKKFSRDPSLEYELIIPKRVLEFSQNLLNSKNIKNSVVDKEIFYRNFMEDGPEDVYPSFQYEYERPCILYNGKEYKLRFCNYDTKKFKNEYVVLKAN